MDNKHNFEGNPVDDNENVPVEDELARSMSKDYVSNLLSGGGSRLDTESKHEKRISQYEQDNF
jgi:hypothetical protein